MKVELKRYCDKVHAVECPSECNDGVFLTGTFLRRTQAVSVAFFIFEFQAINRFQICKQLSTTGII